MADITREQVAAALKLARSGADGVSRALGGFGWEQHAPPYVEAAWRAVDLGDFVSALERWLATFPERKVARWDGQAADWRLSPPHRLTDPEGSVINATRAQAIAWGYEVDVLDELRELAHLIETQPNAATSDPYYTVQQKRRDYGIEQGYGEDGFVWVVDGEEREPAEWSEENGEPFDPDDPPPGWRQVYYRERWEHVHAFMTREAALAFMAREAHNHGPLRTYVESACRNPEMRRLRALPAQCAAEIAKLREQLAAKGST